MASARSAARCAGKDPGPWATLSLTPDPRHQGRGRPCPAVRATAGRHLRSSKAGGAAGPQNGNDPTQLSGNGGTVEKDGAGFWKDADKGRSSETVRSMLSARSRLTCGGCETFENSKAAARTPSFRSHRAKSGGSRTSALSGFVNALGGWFLDRRLLQRGRPPRLTSALFVQRS